MIQNSIYRFLDSMRGIPIERELSKLEKSQWWNAAQLREFQNARLQMLIEHVYQNIPYYRSVMDIRGLKPNNIRCIDDLAPLPILTKEIVRNEQERLKAASFRLRDVYIGHTGGSTGEPLTYYHDRLTQAGNRAAHRRGFRWSGIEWGDRMITFFGGTLGLGQVNLQEYLRRLVTRQKFYPAFEIRKENIVKIHRLLQSYSPQAISGYTSSLYYLAVLIEQSDLAQMNIPVVFTTGESMKNIYRETMTRVFNGRISDYYGFGEIQGLAYQCPLADFYHFTDEKAIVEILPLDPAKKNIGKVLITDLTNFSFPFIRYESGDVVELLDHPCDCGRSLTTVKRILGRLHDFIITRNGNLLAGEFFPHLFQRATSIKYFQVIQDEIDRLEILFVPSQFIGLQKDIDMLTDKIHEYTEPNLQVDFVEVSQIPITPSGKHRVTVSSLDPISSIRGSFIQDYSE